jgi:hypothetical protein
MRCLARDQARRPASADDLKKLLLAALEEARTISSSLAGLKVPSATALVPDPSLRDGSLWWKTIAVVTATVVVAWVAVRPFFVPRPSRPHPALTQARAPAPSPAAKGYDAGTTR